MTFEVLADVMASARRLIEADSSEDWGVLNSIPPGLASDVDRNFPSDYLRFLEIADGAILGAVVILDVKSAARAQSWIAEGMTDVVLGGGEWFVVGKVNENPVLMNRGDGAIWTFPNMRTTWWESLEFERISGRLDEFLLEYGFGRGYLALSNSQDGDQWWKLLRAAGRVG